ncbi:MULTISPECIES: aminopeptidase C [Sanguibacteroides]|uniref:Aminopeptidase n=1 Tax=Sanguibacteroides justesenii TaxID=1547597 RepID=A0A0C3RI68_9PORP|nr:MULTISPECIES: C1 family peptidase [Sanguibacteroides]KIO46027.1 aminopeptidase [Sanguibacteroides justesenii]KIO47096.1 aminopeptidase [Sanguibacteroides justesenii]
MIRKFLLMAVIVFTGATMLLAQKQGGPRSGYQFETIADLKTTPVKDQQSVGTCWDYAALSFLESELLRMGKPEYDLSELFVAKNTYYEKGIRYIQFHGSNNFGEGGQAHDVILMIKKYGIVPEEVYTGLQYGRDFHIHGELVEALKGMLDGINKNPNRRLTPVWPKAYESIIDTYLGATPEKFTYKGKEYTPKTFEASLGLNLDDYVEITSFQEFPFYTQVVLPIPDNWAHGVYYNLPIDELIEIMNNSLKKGYTVCWDGDVSHNSFNHGAGLAILPTDEPSEMINAEIDKWQTLSEKERKSKMSSFEEPVPEMRIDDSKRQFRFDNRQTTDDHLMHITGLLKDQNGTLYYKTKNSWNADSNPFGGYLYMSEPYCRLQTVAIMVHKDAIPKAIRKKLGL